MAEMSQTLESMRQSIERKVHATDSAGPLRSAVNRSINDAYAKVVSAHEWIWNQAEGAMLTYPKVGDADAGALTVAGVGNVTLTAGVAGDIANVGSGWIIKSSVRRHVASKLGAAMTLAVGWPNTDNVTSYDLICYAYNPSSLAIGKVNHVCVESGSSEVELEYIDTHEFYDEYVKDISTGTPEHYTILRYSAAGNPLFGFGPIPDTQQQIMFRYYRRAQRLSADTDTFIVPPQWHHVIEEGALADLYGSFFQDQYQANRHDGQFSRLLRTMMSECQATTKSVFYLGGKKKYPDWGKVDPCV